MSGPGHRASERTRGVFRGDIATETVGEVLKKFYELEPSVLRRMQALQFAGGFYGDAEVTDIAWGQHDEASFGAWSEAVARTARMSAAGKQVTYHQVIGDAARSPDTLRRHVGGTQFLLPHTPARFASLDESSIARSSTTAGA